VLTLHLTFYGQPLDASTHEDFEDLGDTLAKALNDAGLGLTPRTVSVLLSLMFSDLRARLTWRWIGQDYEIFVARDGP